MTLIKGGVAVDRENQHPVDVLIEGDTIVAVEDSMDQAGHQVVDATGCFIGPGFVDLHVHFRDPGQTWKEDLESGSESAVAGGFTGAVMMPNTLPPIDDAFAVNDVLRRGSEIGLLELAVAGALTAGRSGARPSDISGMYAAGVRMFSDDGDSVADETLLRQCMETVQGLEGAFISQHAEDTALTDDGHMHEGTVSASLNIGGLPSIAEDRIVERDIRLAEETRCGLHVQHVSTSGSVDLVANAKARGARVTAEVTPHHLLLEEQDVADLDTNLKMYPPLRSGEDRMALVEALIDGVIDVVATDHAPHSNLEKDVAFSLAPRGVIGLETAASVAWQVLKGDVGFFFDRMSVAPARIGRFQRQGRAIGVGHPANLVIWDPAATWIPGQFASRSANTPFLGKTMTGQVRNTIYEGKVVYQNGSQ